jgi:hypothetical protein
MIRRFFAFSCFASLAALFADGAFSKPISGAGRIRSASSSGSAARSASSGGVPDKRSGSSAPASARGSGGVPSKVAGRSSNSSKTEEDTSSAAVPSGAESCLGPRIAGLLENECSYLVPNEVAVSLDLEKKPFYCVFSYKESGNIDSASGYFLRAAYNMYEDQLGSEGIARMVRDTTNVAMYRYYDYVLDQIEAGTLHESMVMDSLANEALSGSAAITGLDNAQKTSIKKKHVEQIAIPLSVSSVDLDRCRRASKAAFVDQCKMMGNVAAKKLVRDSCSEYEEILQVVASDRKSRAVASAPQIRLALLKRIMASTAEEKALTEFKSELAAQLDATAKASYDFSLAEPKSKRGEAVVKLSPMLAEYADMKEGSAKNRQKKEIDALRAEICNYDRQIVVIDPAYKAPDCQARCKDGVATGAEPEGCPADDAAQAGGGASCPEALKIRYGVMEGGDIKKDLAAGDHKCAHADMGIEDPKVGVAKKCWYLKEGTGESTFDWEEFAAENEAFAISCDAEAKKLKAAKK